MQYLHTQRGFTLTELMIALAVSSIMIIGMYEALVQQQRGATQQAHRTETWQNTRLTLDIMIQDIRAAGFDPGGLAGAGIEEADDVHIRFTRDLNCNGTLASSNTSTPAKGVPDPPPGRTTSDEDITYRFDPTSHELGRLIHADGTPTGGLQPVASNILDLKFCYFMVAKPAGPCETHPINLNDIRAVQITLTSQVATTDPSYADIKATLTSLVRIRNLGVDRGNKRLDFDDPCPLL